MSQQILIEELSPSQCGIITESSTDGKNTWLNGIFMQSSITNRNGRIYPINEIQSAVDSANTRIKETNGIFGELDHPTSLSVSLDRISHVITEMRMEGQNAVGKIRILTTPLGNIAKTLIESGVAIGVSSRGAGQVNEEGIVSGFSMQTIDLVATPSAQGAYPTPMVESLGMATNGKHIMTLAESLKEDPAAQKYLKAEITKWLNTGLFAKK